MHAKRVLAADRLKARAEAERVEQKPRQSFELVGAYGEAASARGENIERAAQPGNGREGRRYGRQ